MTTISFKGKGIIQNHHLQVKYHNLVPMKDMSLTDEVSINDNLIIHGDNLVALKALLPYYAGKVNCIFIDPPYNTGESTWVYNDNVNSPMLQEWLGKEVNSLDLTRHDKWCCMMLPRLKLLKELLHKDGSIFVTISDIEHHRLRMLMDEVFGADNFVTNIVWQARKSVSNDTDISESHNHIVVYSNKRRATQRRLKEKNADTWFSSEGFAMRPIPLSRSKFDNPNDDERGPWKTDPFDAPNVRENLTYGIENPNTGDIYYPPKGRCWRTDQEKYFQLLNDDRIMFGKNGVTGPVLKVFYEEKKEYGSVETTWWGNGSDGFTSVDEENGEEIISDKIDYGTTTNATKMLQQIGINFDTPKPIELIKHIVKLSTGNEGLILDSFAGSGATGHAVLDLNNNDSKSNRKFIMIECEDYCNDITTERIRRVINGVPDASSESLRNGIGGTFSYFDIGEPIEFENILNGECLPTYNDLAAYIYFNSTGKTIDIERVDETRNYIGNTEEYEIYLYYRADLEYLKNTALDVEKVSGLPQIAGKKNLIFAPMKYIDSDYLQTYNSEYCQLPIEVYKIGR